MITETIKEDGFNTALKYPSAYKEIVENARKYSKSIFKDYDCILISIYLLMENGSKDVKLYLKNDYAKQLKNEIKELFKIK